MLIFGIGGVGSWCAEGLLRSGVRNITIVDSDRVCVTNCNRQLMATSRTLGEVKVEALRNRLLEINPDANITAYQKYIRQILPMNSTWSNTTSSSMPSTRSRIRLTSFCVPLPCLRKSPLYLLWELPCAPTHSW